MIFGKRSPPSHYMLRRTAQNAPGLTISPLPLRRGVFHRVGIDGVTTFEIRDHNGALQFEVRVAKEHCTRRTVRWLHTVLDAIDPPAPRLNIA